MTGAPLTHMELDAPVRAVTFSPDGRQIAAGDGSGAVHIFDLLLGEDDKQAWLTRLLGKRQ